MDRLKEGHDVAEATIDLADGRVDAEKTHRLMELFGVTATKMLELLGSVSRSLSPEMVAALGDAVTTFDAVSALLG